MDEELIDRLVVLGRFLDTVHHGKNPRWCRAWDAVRKIVPSYIQLNPTAGKDYVDPTAAHCERARELWLRVPVKSLTLPKDTDTMAMIANAS